MTSLQQNNMQNKIERIKKEIYCKADLRKTKKVRINLKMG